MKSDLLRGPISPKTEKSFDVVALSILDHQLIRNDIKYISLHRFTVKKQRKLFSTLAIKLKIYGHAKEQALYDTLMQVKSLRQDAIKRSLENRQIINLLEIAHPATEDEETFFARLQVLNGLIENHFRNEKKMFIKIKKQFSFEQREEIGLVFKEMKEEIFLSSSFLLSRKSNQYIEHQVMH
jgi:hypothetical protein